MTARCTEKYGARKTPDTATRASSTGKGRAPAAWSAGIAAKSGTRARSHVSIVRRVPTRPAIAPPQKPSTATGRTSAMITQVMRCGEPVVRSTNHGSASHVICVPVEEITSATSSAASRRSRSRLHGSAVAPKLTITVPRAATVLAAAVLVEQRLEPLAELFELLRRQLERSPTTSAPRAATAAGSSCSRRSASRTRCCWRATSSSRSTVASIPSDGNSIRVAVARHGRSRPAPPMPSLDEAPLRERAQVVAARRRALVDELRALGRGRLVDRVEVVEQREAGRVREGAHRPRVGQRE